MVMAVKSSETRSWVGVILLWKAAGSGGHRFPTSFSASNNTNHDCYVF